MERDPLEIDPETMRRLGYQAVDWLVERAHGRRDEPVLRQASPAEMARRVPGTAPAVGRDLAEILAPPRRGRAAVPQPDRPPALPRLRPGGGDLARSAGRPDRERPTTSTSATGWSPPGRASSRPSCCAGSPTGSATRPRPPGVLVSGGSAANLTAMACAREALVGAMRDDARRLRLRAGPLLAGAGRPGARLPAPAGAGAARGRAASGCGSDALEAAIDARPRRRAAVRWSCSPSPVRRTPARSTTSPSSRGSVAEHGVWLHVDGAYGAFAALTERGREALTGLELADSVTLDPHKWLYQPFECGALLVRAATCSRRPSRSTRRTSRTPTARDGEVNFADARPAADPDEPRAQALGVAAVLRRGRLRRRDRPGDGPRRARPARDRGGTRARAAGAGHPGHRLLPPAPARAGRRGGPRAGSTPTSSPPWRRAERGSSPPPGCPAGTPSACACSTTARRRPTSTGCWTGSQTATFPDAADAARPDDGPAVQETKTADVGGGLAGTGRSRRRRAPRAAAPRGRRGGAAALGRIGRPAPRRRGRRDGRAPVGGRPGLLPAPRGRAPTCSARAGC